MRDINEIWIIKPGGITLFNMSKDSIDPVLIGGFFSAIQTFVEQIGEKELRTLQLGDSKITIYHGRDGYLFISRSEKKSKDKKIMESLRMVEIKFFEQYSDALTRYSIDVNIFRNFGEIIEDIFKDTPEKRTQEALW